MDKTKTMNRNIISIYIEMLRWNDSISTGYSKRQIEDLISAKKEPKRKTTYVSRYGSRY